MEMLTRRVATRRILPRHLSMEPPMVTSRASPSPLLRYVVIGYYFLMMLKVCCFGYLRHFISGYLTLLLTFSRFSVFYKAWHCIFNTHGNNAIYRWYGQVYVYGIFWLKRSVSSGAGVYTGVGVTRGSVHRLCHRCGWSPQLLLHLPCLLRSIPTHHRLHWRAHQVLEVQSNGDWGRDRSAQIWVEGMGHDDTHQW